MSRLLLVVAVLAQASVAHAWGSITIGYSAESTSDFSGTIENYETHPNMRSLSIDGERAAGGIAFGLFGFGERFAGGLRFNILGLDGTQLVRDGSATVPVTVQGRVYALTADFGPNLSAARLLPAFGVYSTPFGAEFDVSLVPTLGFSFGIVEQGSEPYSQWQYERDRWVGIPVRLMLAVRFFQVTGQLAVGKEWRLSSESDFRSWPLTFDAGVGFAW